VSQAFEIKLLRSGQTCSDPIHDTCLAGALRVTINGVVIADDDDYGIADSALALMRTVDRDHNLVDRVIRSRYLLCHDCAFPDLACSNFGTTWTVTHRNGAVHLADVESYTTHPIRRHLTFPDAETDIAEEDYRTEVVRFARQAKDAYFANGPRIVDPDWRDLYGAFWREYDELLERLT
jgi:hypothetical protein